MEAIKVNGLIAYYQDWKCEKTPATEVFNNILAIQEQQLLEWKLRLNDTVYTALETAVKTANEGLTAETHNAYDCIKRGCQMSSFIANWRPNKPINEIYW